MKLFYRPHGQTPQMFWEYLVRAVEKGRWKPISYLRERVPPPASLGSAELRDIPMEEVKSFPDGWYKWMGLLETGAELRRGL